VWGIENNISATSHVFLITEAIKRGFTRELLLQGCFSDEI
jgi:hypothetical protein